LKRKILVYDDVERWATNYTNHLTTERTVSSRFDVEPIANGQLQEQLRILEGRQAASRGTSHRVPGQSKFDDVDVFIVDIDLVESANPFLTGDRLAYLIRCFSECEVIIGLSQYQKVDFDLTLKGQPGSFTDLSIKNTQLTNRGLWGNSWSNFRPWAWPVIPNLLESFEKRVRIVEENPAASVIETIGLKSAVSSLPNSAIDFLGSDPDTVTFEGFVLHSQYGIRDPDRPFNREFLARIAASRISKCVEYLILPGQGVVVDAPHLVSRFPSLLTGSKTAKSSWNKTTKFLPPNRIGLRSGKISRFRLKAEEWYSRPVWLSGPLSDFQGIDEVKSPWKSIEPNFLFCEDASAFYPRKDCLEFEASVESPNVRRYIRNFRELTYGPKSNMLQSK
jgi:hypothetical protein